MARYARVVVPGVPYHVTHRGNRREPVFFDDDQRDDLLSDPRPFPAPKRVGDWADWLAQGLSDEDLAKIRLHTGTGRPCGDETFIDRLEGLLRRLLRPRKRGPKPKEMGNKSGS